MLGESQWLAPLKVVYFPGSIVDAQYQLFIGAIR